VPAEAQDAPSFPPADVFSGSSLTRTQPGKHLDLLSEKRLLAFVL